MLKFIFIFFSLLSFVYFSSCSKVNITKLELPDSTKSDCEFISNHVTKKKAEVKFESTHICDLMEIINNLNNNNQAAGEKNSLPDEEKLKKIYKELEIGAKTFVRNIHISNKVDSLISIYSKYTFDEIKDSMKFGKGNEINIGDESMQEIAVGLADIAADFKYKKDDDKIDPDKCWKKLESVGYCKQLIISKIKDVGD